MLEVDEVACRQWRNEEAVGRGPLAIDDHVGVGLGKQGVGQHLEALDADAALKLAIGQIIEVVEPPLEGCRLVWILVEGVVVEVERADSGWA